MVIQMSRLARACAKLRFKIFRLMSIMLLGRECGQSIIGQCVFSDLEFANDETVRARISQRKPLSEAAVQEYNLQNVPKCWRTMFSRCTVFPRRYAYVLNDVAIGPESGVVYMPSRGYFANDGIIFIPSVGNSLYLFQNGIQEVMCRTQTLDVAVPVCPMPVIGYYHDMFECLLHVIIARRVFGDIMVVVAGKRPKYIDQMLEFIGLEESRIVVSDCPVLVKKGILIPRWNDSGENLREDVCELREALVRRLPDVGGVAEKVYISRKKSRRPLPNETEIEMMLADGGFKIVYFEDMSFSEQLCTIRAAKVIVAPHGAGLANIVVARPGTRIVEIMTQGWANSCYGHLATSLGLDYTCIDADDGSSYNLLKDL